MSSIAAAYVGDAVAAGAVESVPQAQQSLELQQLAQQRADLEQRFKADSLACEQRFAVNDCLDRVRAQRNLALKPILAREQDIDRLERQARAEAQRLRVLEREREAAVLEAQRRTAELLAAQRAAIRAHEDIDSPPPVKLRASPQELEQTQRAKQLRADQEAQRRLAQRQAFERQQAQQRRDAQQRLDAREEAQSKGKKASAPLPIPSAEEIAAAGQVGTSAASAAASSKR
ncbi:hypothetical protein WG899_08070 [Paucibacter sp. AS339]|uniref:hypothetical protein n=1 Tax=Paucibacter hankyongi TaxID=3133434 RepID=UPI0030B0B118